MAGVDSIRQVVLQVLSLCDLRSEETEERRQKREPLQDRHLVDLTKFTTRESKSGAGASCAFKTARGKRSK